MDLDDSILVTGAGGFIGGSMVANLREAGYRNIRAVDIKPFDEWYRVFPDAENLQLDLTRREQAASAAILPLIWAVWALSKAIKRAACSRC
jgi:nucleoside-diphosphate-sugar epimerase